MVWRFSWMAVTSVALAALGCGSSEGAHDGGNSGRGGEAGSAGSPANGGSAGIAGSAGVGGTAPTVDEFCQLWLDEFSAYMERCACDAASVMHYREGFATECGPTGFLGSLPAAVAAGDFSYDGHAALSLFERLHEPDPQCREEPFLALKLDSVEIYSLAGVFLGTRALGEPCAHAIGYKGGLSDCREGVCASDGAEAGVCIAFVGLGEECDASGDEDLRSTVPRLCHVRRPPDDDGEYESAFDSVTCDASAGDPVRRCVNDRPDGSACRSSEACRSGLCLGTKPSDDGVCVAKTANGEPCQNHFECASGACQNALPRVCGALLADGEACSYSDFACESGFCPREAGRVVCAAPPTLAPGESCTLNSECTGNGQDNPHGAVCQAGICVTEICAEYAE